MTTRSELDEFLDLYPRADGARRDAIGTVVGGSLSQGVLVKLDVGQVPGGLIEDMAVGRYVVVEGKTNRKFFSIVTDIQLDSTNPDLAKSPPNPDDVFMQEVYASELAFGALSIAPMLLLESAQAAPKPVKTVPAHFSRVFLAAPEEVDQIFGREDDQHWYIGSPLDMDQARVNLDLARFVERSSGVFGKSGTGKSFITRTILAGIIKHGAAVNLIFDMHNDYGWEVSNEQGQKWKGLRQLFDHSRVQVFTLDPATSRARQSKVDGVLQIGLDNIEPEDVELLRDVLSLSDVQVGALYYLRRKLGRAWLSRMLDENDTEAVDAIEEEERVQKGTLRAMQRKFEIFRPDHLAFLTEHQPDNVVEHIFELLNRGISVVLEYGVYGDSLAAYLLVANYLTRRIHARYVERKNRAAGNQAEEPRPVVITIEEAHKFLDPKIAENTIFGTIARELRKYNVTLLIVDQRPSGIQDDVMSQIGTRVTCLLDNEADIRAVFSGVSGAGQLREVLARLDTQQQALILGHAVPMPVVVKTREYGEALYAAVGFQDEATRRRNHERGSQALWGEEVD